MSHRDRRIAALAALAAVLFPSTAEAMVTTPGAGISAGVSFFQKKASFNLTVEAYVTEGWSTPGWEIGCHAYPDTTAIGPMAAISFARGGPRVIAALIGGAGIGDSALSAGGELGVVIGAAGEPGVGLHAGATVGLSMLAATVRSEAMRETSVTGGFRVLPPYGSYAIGCAIPGRPRRDGDGVRIDAGTGSGWAKDAQDEAASVLAFLDLAQALLEQDAPEALVDAALDSAQDEIGHALLCAAQAGVAPELPAFVPRPRLRGREALERIATESFHDGWINEGQAARDALRRMHVAHGTARAALAIIARDEARHARLGRAVVGWAVDRGGRIAHLSNRRETFAVMSYRSGSHAENSA